MFETKENYFSPYKVKKGTFFLYNSGIYTRVEKRQLIFLAIVLTVVTQLLLKEAGPEIFFPAPFTYFPIRIIRG